MRSAILRAVALPPGLRAALPPGLHAALTAILLLALPAMLAAQRVDTRFGQEPQRESYVVEIAKWSTGGIALATGAWAFGMQRDAENRLEQLELFCAEQEQSCADITTGGEYRDAALESRYQDIRRDFRNSRWLLIGAQVLAATSVVLFIVDLPRHSTPDNEPYDPPALRVGAGPDGAIELSFSLRLPHALTHRRDAR